MTFRFRRTVRLAPGVRLNIGKRGVSLSMGPRGASVTVGGSGAFFNAGIPGTGLSSRQRLSGGSTRPKKVAHADESDDGSLSLITRLNDDGSVDFLDSNENPLPDEIINRAKHQKGDFIREWLASQCEKINSQISSLENIHLETPPPDRKPSYSPELFTLHSPLPPISKPLGILGRLFKSVRTRIENENEVAFAEYGQRYREWTKAQSDFDDVQRKRKYLLEQRLYSDPSAMYEVLESSLQSIEWPRETNVSYEIDPSGKKVFVDVDLPVIEDMPGKSASLPSRGWKVTMKALTDTKLRQLYMNHVHGVGFRLIGEIFATLPTVNEVALSAYSQRASKATGEIQDEYLYSVRVSRNEWSKINFSNLGSVDMVTALDQFELRRKMTKTGLFTPIDPYSNPNQVLIT